MMRVFARLTSHHGMVDTLCSTTRNTPNPQNPSLSVSAYSSRPNGRPQLREEGSLNHWCSRDGLPLTKRTAAYHEAIHLDGRPTAKDMALYRCIVPALHAEPMLLTSLVTSCLQSDGPFKHGRRDVLKKVLDRCIYRDPVEVSPAELSGFKVSRVEVSRRYTWEIAFQVADELSTRIGQSGSATLLSLHYLSLRNVLYSALSRGEQPFGMLHASSREKDYKKHLLLKLASARPSEDLFQDRADQLSAFRMIKAAETASNLGLDQDNLNRGTALLTHMLLHHSQTSVAKDVKRVLRVVSHRPIPYPLSPRTESTAESPRDWEVSLTDDLRQAWSDSGSPLAPSDWAEEDENEEDKKWAAEHVGLLINGLSCSPDGTVIFDDESTRLDRA